MNKKIATLLVCVAIGRLVAASDPLTLKAQSEMWGDDAMARTVSKTLISGAKDEKAVRAQLAGINDSFFKTGLLLVPEEIHFGRFLGYPAFFVRGVSLANFRRRRCSITVVFTVAYTYTIHCFSPDAVELPDPEKFIRIDGEPSHVTEGAFSYLEPRLREGLPQMQELARQAAVGGAAQPNK